MEKYKVFRRDELRDKCKCGFCFNKKGFKNTLKTWHASVQLFTDKIEHAFNYIDGEQEKYVIFKAKYAWNFEQIEDYKEVKI